MHLLCWNDVWAESTWIPSAFVFTFHCHLSVTHLARVWEKRFSECCSLTMCAYIQVSAAGEAYTRCTLTGGITTNCKLCVLHRRRQFIIICLNPRITARCVFPATGTQNGKGLCSSVLSTFCWWLQLHLKSGILCMMWAFECSLSCLEWQFLYWFIPVVHA